MAQETIMQKNQNSGLNISSDNIPVKDKTGKKVASSILLVLSVLLLVLIILGGFFYFIVKSNVGGFAESNRNMISKIPIISTALPKKADAEDPNKLTTEELKQKYKEHVDQIKQLQEKIDSFNNDMQNYKNLSTEYDKLKQEYDQLKKDSDSKQAQLAADSAKLKKDKQDFQTSVAKNDTSGFKAYYESIDPEYAKQLYQEIVKQQIADDNVKKLIQSYELMDENSAAAILEDLYKNQKDLAITILNGMAKDKRANILAAMKTETASMVTKDMYDAMKK